MPFWSVAVVGSPAWLVDPMFAWWELSEIDAVGDEGVCRVVVVSGSAIWLGCCLGW